MYVRQSYVDIVNIIMAQAVVSAGPNRTPRVQALVKGTPGIGKSVFLAYLLWTIVQNNREKKISIVYKSGPDNVLALMATDTSDAEIWSTHKDAPPRPQEFWDAVSDAVNTPSSWVLLDSCEHLEEAEAVANTVLVTSPRADIFNEFAKFAKDSTLWMPVWTWEELEDCRNKVYKHIPIDHLQKFAEISGGIPRLVFQTKADEKARDEWCDSIKREIYMKLPRSMDGLRTIVDVISASVERSEASHRILHFYVLDEFFDASSPGIGYRHSRVQFPSAWVEELTTTALERANANDIVHLINSAAGQVGWSGPRSIMFESWAHRTLPLGGQTYEIKRLDGPDPKPTGTIAFLANPAVLFWKLRELSMLADKVYAHPRTKILGAVDALMRPDKMFQMTIGEKHPIKAARLQDAMAMLQPQGQLRLYFVIPRDRWDDFKEQPYHSSGSPSHVLQNENVPTEIRNRVEQWALLFTPSAS